jgi:hypothetical protein
VEGEGDAGEAEGKECRREKGSYANLIESRKRS